MKDIQVFTALDSKTVAAEKLDILLLSTEGAADMATYNDLEKLKAAFPRKKVAAMADKMFNQDNTLADTLIRKVRVAGIENPQNVGGTASRIEIAFGENMPTETLEASTAYYAKIGGKAVVEITTSEEVPVDCTGLAKLFAGTSFEEDGVKFTAAVDDNTVTYTSTTRTAVSGYAESISLYKDADCFEDMGLSGAVVSVSVGKADTTKAENLIAAIEDLRDHNDDWYFILTDVTDPACVTALCKWAESTEPTEAALGAGVEDPVELDALDPESDGRSSHTARLASTRVNSSVGQRGSHSLSATPNSTVPTPSPNDAGSKSRTWRNSVSRLSSAVALPGTSTPSTLGNWPKAITTAAPRVNPTTTECETKLASAPNFSIPSSH